MEYEGFLQKKNNKKKSPHIIYYILTNTYTHIYTHTLPVLIFFDNLKSKNFEKSIYCNSLNPLASYNMSSYDRTALNFFDRSQKRSQQDTFLQGKYNQTNLNVTGHMEND